MSDFSTQKYYALLSKTPQAVFCKVYYIIVKLKIIHVLSLKKNLTSFTAKTVWNPVVVAPEIYLYIRNPGDFVTKVKQINSQSDLIWMRSLAGPSYFTIRSSVNIILIWGPCIFNLYNLCQTGSNYIRQEPQQYALHFNEQTIKHFLLLQPSIRPVPAQVILLWKGPPKLCIESHLVPLVSVPAKITWMKQAVLKVEFLKGGTLLYSRTFSTIISTANHDACGGFSESSRFCSKHWRIWWRT